MEQAAQHRGGDRQAAGDGGAEGGGGGSRREVAWLPGTSFRLLPDDTVSRWVTNEGVLLDYAIRLRGAVDEIRRQVHQPGCVGDGVVDQPCTCRRADDADILERWGV